MLDFFTRVKITVLICSILGTYRNTFWLYSDNLALHVLEKYSPATLEISLGPITVMSFQEKPYYSEPSLAKISQMKIKSPDNIVVVNTF